MQLGAEKLNQLIRDEKPIYIVNRTKPRGILVITFPNGNLTERVVVPKTAHPFNLSARVPYEAINASMEFRRLLSRRYIDLVEPGAAEKILDDPEVAEELQEATERTFKHGPESLGAPTDETASSDAVKAMKEMVKGVQNKTASSTSRNEDFAEEEDDSEPDLRVRVIMQRVADQDLGLRPALVDLKAIATELQEKDFSYILSQAPTGNIAKWARRKLEKLHTPTDTGTTAPVHIED